MTTEKRILISIADIVSVGWTCPHCKASFSVPVDSADKERIFQQCPNCNGWIAPRIMQSLPVGTDETLKDFLAALKKLQNTEAGAAVRLEIADLPEER
jgi:hypothetical protein